MLARVCGKEIDWSADWSMTYDASYLDLALRRGLPLATGDDRLRDACGRTGVPIID